MAAIFARHDHHVIHKWTPCTGQRGLVQSSLKWASYPHASAEVLHGALYCSGIQTQQTHGLLLYGRLADVIAGGLLWAACKRARTSAAVGAQCTPEQEAAAGDAVAAQPDRAHHLRHAAARRGL